MSTGHNQTIGAKMPRGDLRQLYDGPEMIMEPDSGAWVPVVEDIGNESATGKVRAVFSSSFCQQLETAPGLWQTEVGPGLVFVCNVGELDVPLTQGAILGEVAEVGVQTVVCHECGGVDTEA